MRRIIRDASEAPTIPSLPAYVDGSIVQRSCSFVYGYFKEWTSISSNLLLFDSSQIRFSQEFFNVPFEQDRQTRRNLKCRIRTSVTAHAQLTCLHHTNHFERRVTMGIWTGQGDNRQTSSYNRTTKQEKKITNQWSVLNHDIHPAADPLPKSLQTASGFWLQQPIFSILSKAQELPPLFSVLFNMQKIKGWSSFSVLGL